MIEITEVSAIQKTTYQNGEGYLAERGLISTILIQDISVINNFLLKGCFLILFFL